MTDAIGRGDSRGPNAINRRWLLKFGGVGLATFVNACAPRTHPNEIARQSTSESQHLVASTAPAVTASGSPPSETIALPPSEATSMSRTILCREAWGARPPRPGGTPQVPTRLTIHHSAVTLGANSNAPARIRADQRYHQDSQGWIDIAYHIGVDRNGNIYELRDPGIVGDTATSYDPTGHFLVLCEGNFDEEDVTEAMLDGVALACAWASHRYSISTEMISGHRDFAATSCPGSNLYAYVESRDIARRAEGFVAAGAENLQLVCGPQAVARVEAIAAGY